MRLKLEREYEGERAMQMKWGQMSLATMWSHKGEQGMKHQNHGMGE